MHVGVILLISMHRNIDLELRLTVGSIMKIRECFMISNGQKNFNEMGFEFSGSAIGIS